MWKDIGRNGNGDKHERLNIKADRRRKETIRIRPLTSSSGSGLGCVIKNEQQAAAEFHLIVHRVQLEPNRLKPEDLGAYSCQNFVIIKIIKVQILKQSLTFSVEVDSEEGFES